MLGILEKACLLMGEREKQRSGWRSERRTGRDGVEEVELSSTFLDSLLLLCVPFEQGTS